MLSLFNMLIRLIWVLGIIMFCKKYFKTKSKNNANSRTKNNDRFADRFEQSSERADEFVDVRNNSNNQILDGAQDDDNQILDFSDSWFANATTQPINIENSNTFSSKNNNNKFSESETNNTTRLQDFLNEYGMEEFDFDSML